MRGCGEPGLEGLQTIKGRGGDWSSVSNQYPEIEATCICILVPCPLRLVIFYKAWILEFGFWNFSILLFLVPFALRLIPSAWIFVT